MNKTDGAEIVIKRMGVRSSCQKNLEIRKGKEVKDYSSTGSSGIKMEEEIGCSPILLQAKEKPACPGGCPCHVVYEGIPGTASALHQVGALGTRTPTFPFFPFF